MHHDFSSRSALTSSNPNDPESVIFGVPEMHDNITDADNGNGSFRSSASARRRAVSKPISKPRASSGRHRHGVRLDPTSRSHHESRLVDLLARFTQMPVSEAAHGQKVESNHVYIIPPNVNLAIVEGRLQVSPRARHAGSLSHGFFSFAPRRKTKSISMRIVLSGTESDGAQGVCGSRRWAASLSRKTERSAKFSGMPHSAHRERPAPI